jgi:serine/threonine-protein kinase HipA
MTINGRDTDFSCNDMLEVARRFNIKKAKTIIDNAIIVTKLYPQFAKEAGVEERWSKCIFQEIEKRVAWLES